MATKSEIKNKRAEVKEMIKTRLREDPDIGPHEFVGHFLQAKGIEVDAKDPEAIRSKVKELEGKDKSDTVRALSEYRKLSEKAITDLDKGLHHNITELPRKAIAAITKGAGIGIFAPTTVTAGAVLAVGAITGAVTYTAGKAVVSGVKALYNGIKDKKQDKER